MTGRLMILIMILMMGIRSSNSQPSPKQVEELQLQIKSVRQVIEKNHLDIFGTPYDLPGYSEFDKLCRTVPVSWQIAVKNLPEIAPDELSQLILIYALQYLPADDYVSAGKELISLAEQNKLSKKALRWAIAPPLRHSPLFIDNYKDPDVVGILTRAQTIFRDQPRAVKSYERTLSGKSKRDWDAHRKRSTLSPTEGGPPAPVYLKKNKGDDSSAESE